MKKDISTTTDLPRLDRGIHVLQIGGPHGHTLKGTRAARNRAFSTYRVRGVALLIVLFALAFMSAIVTDLSYNEIVRYKMAIYERDALKAEALAKSGINFTRLILIVQDKLQGLLMNASKIGMVLPSYNIVDLIPMDSDMIKGLITGDLLSTLGIDISESLAAQEAPVVASNESGEKKFESTFEAPKNGFGAFDGSFSVETTVEEGKISLRGWASETSAKKRKDRYDLIYGLVEPKRYDALFTGQEITRPIVVGNIFDYMNENPHITDPLAPAEEWGSRGSGSKDGLYSKYEGLKPKSAYFDSLQELRLVHGVTDAFMRVFGGALTIYGTGGKINLSAASNQVIEALARYCAADKLDPKLKTEATMNELVTNFKQRIGEGALTPTTDSFVGYLKEQGLAPEEGRCKDILTDKMNNFTIRATGTVGEVSRTLTLVAYIASNVEELSYFGDGG